MANDRGKYFEVVAKCGHVGRTGCVMIHFAIKAESKAEAAAKVRKYKRVKRDHKDCIRGVKEISFVKFMELRSINDLDPYLHCKSKWQQKLISGFEARIEKDEYNIARIQKKSDRQQSRKYRYSKLLYATKEGIKEIEEYYCG